MTATLDHRKTNKNAVEAAAYSELAASLSDIPFFCSRCHAIRDQYGPCTVCETGR